MTKEEIDQKMESPRFPIFSYFHLEHDLILLDSEIDEIIHQVKLFAELELTADNAKRDAEIEILEDNYHDIYKRNDDLFIKYNELKQLADEMAKDLQLGENFRGNSLTNYQNHTKCY